MRAHPAEVVTRAAVGVAVGLTVACTTVGVVHYTTLWSVLLPAVAVAFLSVPVVGAAMVRSDRRNAVGWILVAAGVGLPLACTGYLLAEAAYVGGADIPGAEWAGWWDGWPWVFAVGLVPTVGLLLFPDGRLPSPRWRPVLWVCVVQMTALLLGLLFSPALLDFPDQANPTALPGVWGSVAEGLGGAVALTAPLSTLAAWSVRRRLSRTREADQARALALVAPAAWLIAASWWGCLVIAVWGEATITALPAEVFGMLALAVTSWVAIRRYGLFDGRQVLNRTLVYGLLTTLVIAVYLAVAAAVRVLASDAVSGAVAVAAAVLIALPLRDVLQRTANRLVYGYRDDPYGALVRLGRRLEAAAAADQVLPGVARTVREALRLPYVAVRVGVATVAEAGRPASGACEEFPLVFAGETIGELVAQVRDEGPFTVSERGLLTGIAGQVAAAGHAVSLTEDLLRSRERLVGAAEEERRRLRRDLHDGLGPTLAGVVLGLHRARRHLLTDAAAAAGQMDTLTDQMQQAVADVRRLVYGLRPPALDELGLVGALNEQARSLGIIVVEGPARQPALPAAVEVAAYRIAMEAMTNTIRHARASHGTVRVVIDDALRLEISDNGTGLPDGYRAGVGITSMRERAAELSGTCVIEPRAPHGTLVRAVIPLEST
ncbi:sensor histidine kinase [Streptosporangium lutulentum]|uniref:histidine kinase n=1 Tax=Streptosporangium lutulentum TaxID=1461250 RepID=A0ABT9Q8I1_9ACTN|nr:histidine kinase [Streptosporangium lutulentum]MDP9843053.1 signal transduction histidine kinase [Streptosporangium lutulentum]